MDGENHGKPYFLMDDLGGNPLFLETPIQRYKSQPSKFPIQTTFALQMLAEGTIVMVNKGIVQAENERCVCFLRNLLGRPFKGG